MTRRKSIARRRPVIVYRIEHDPQDPTVINIRSWFAHDDVTARLDQNRPAASGRITEWDAPRVRGQWLDNRDTDAIHELPEELREYLWEMDDVSRKRIRY